MVDPRRVPGDHVVFVTGNDIEAKETVRTLLRQFGWEDDVIHDLGDVRLDTAFFAWRMEGREGVGRYDVMRRAGRGSSRGR